MKKSVRDAVALMIVVASAFSLSSCEDPSPTASPAAATLTFDFQFAVRGEPYENYDVYAAWIANDDEGFIQNIFVCERVIGRNGGLTGRVLPYWKTNYYPGSTEEADAIAAATLQDQDVAVDFSLKDPSIRRFTVYFEIDRSNEYNDWFTDQRVSGAPDWVQDQPALLYKADVDLDSGTDVYDLEFVAWTPNEFTDTIVDPQPSFVPVYEPRHIQNHKDGSAFGDVDDVYRMDRMVESVRLYVND